MESVLGLKQVHFSWAEISECDILLCFTGGSFHQKRQLVTKVGQWQRVASVLPELDGDGVTRYKPRPVTETQQHLFHVYTAVKKNPVQTRGF